MKIEKVQQLDEECIGYVGECPVRWIEEVPGKIDLTSEETILQYDGNTVHFPLLSEIWIVKKKRWHRA